MLYQALVSPKTPALYLEPLAQHLLKLFLERKSDFPQNATRFPEKGLKTEGPSRLQVFSRFGWRMDVCG